MKDYFKVEGFSIVIENDDFTIKRNPKAKYYIDGIYWFALFVVSSIIFYIAFESLFSKSFDKLTGVLMIIVSTFGIYLGGVDFLFRFIKSSTILKYDSNTESIVLSKLFFFHRKIPARELKEIIARRNKYYSKHANIRKTNYSCSLEFLLNDGFKTIEIVNVNSPLLEYNPFKSNEDVNNIAFKLGKNIAMFLEIPFKIK
jgi:hypothetical protein